MTSYIIKRLLYSLLVIFGVLILCFVLFNLASGDPAAAVLGKNPSALEIEQLRNDLGCDKPLFYGHWRKTEAFSSVDFAGSRKHPNLTLSAGAAIKEKILILPPGEKISIRRNFQSGSERLTAFIETAGGDTIERVAVDKTKVFNFSNYSQNTLRISRIEFFRPQSDPFESQFFGALAEIVSFKNAFPYISFFNFGRTIHTREPIKNILARGVWPSLALMVPIFIGESILAIALALLASAAKGSWGDRLIVLTSVAGMSISYLVFIIFGQWYLGYYFNWFPVWGWGSWRYLLLPLIIGSISGLGGGVRFYRTVFVNELNREYLRTATAKGCGALSVYCKHLLANSAVPIIVRAGATLPFLFTGSLLLESFFGIPGLGYAGIDALNNSDLQLLKALVIVSAMLFVLLNLLTDLACAWADPRIRLQKNN